MSDNKWRNYNDKNKTHYYYYYCDHNKNKNKHYYDYYYENDIIYAKGDQNDNWQIDHEENCSNNNNYNSENYHIIHYDIHYRNMK